MWSRIRSSGLARTMCSVGSAMFIGDFTIQQIEQTTTSSKRDAHLTTPNDLLYELSHNRAWNISRSLRMGATGILLSGPISEFTYKGVSRYLANQSAAKKVLAIIAVSPLNISCSISTPSILAGLSSSDVYSKWEREFFPTLCLNTLFWPPGLYIILKKVKLQNRGSVGAIVWFGWSLVLSVIANRS